MWIWILSSIAVVILVLLGCSRVHTIRKVGPEEGIEDNKTVQAYDEISQWPQFKFLRKMIVHKLKSQNPQGILADIGCGPGYLIADIVRSFPHLDIIGVDISEEMVQKATKNLSILGFDKHTSFRQGDIHELPFEHNSLDFVISTLSLHHWSEPTQALCKIYQILKPRGQFLIFDLRRDSPHLFYWLIKFAQIFILPSPLRYMNEPTSSVLASYAPVELKQILAETPFKQWTIQPGIFWSYMLGQKT